MSPRAMAEIRKANQKIDRQVSILVDLVKSRIQTTPETSLKIKSSWLRKRVANQLRESGLQVVESDRSVGDAAHCRPYLAKSIELTVRM